MPSPKIDHLLFVAVLAEALTKDNWSPHYVVSMATEITLLARVLERLAVQECNGPELTPRQCRAQERTINDLRESLSPHGLQVRVGGDPRGYAVKILLPTGRYNTLGGAEEGWGAPT